MLACHWNTPLAKPKAKEKQKTIIKMETHPNDSCKKLVEESAGGGEYTMDYLFSQPTLSILNIKHQS
jgi:hypothetical protein